MTSESKLLEMKSGFLPSYQKSVVLCSNAELRRALKQLLYNPEDDSEMAIETMGYHVQDCEFICQCSRWFLMKSGPLL